MYTLGESYQNVFQNNYTPSFEWYLVSLNASFFTISLETENLKPFLLILGERKPADPAGENQISDFFH